MTWLKSGPRHRNGLSHSLQRWMESRRLEDFDDRIAPVRNRWDSVELAHTASAASLLKLQRLTLCALTVPPIEYLIAPELRRHRLHGAWTDCFSRGVPVETSGSFTDKRKSTIYVTGLGVCIALGTEAAPSDYLLVSTLSATQSVVKLPLHLDSNDPPPHFKGERPRCLREEYGRTGVFSLPKTAAEQYNSAIHAAEVCISRHAEAAALVGGVLLGAAGMLMAQGDVRLENSWELFNSSTQDLFQLPTVAQGCLPEFNNI